LKQGPQRFGIKRVAPRDRKNVLGAQGRPKKCPALRDSLFAWFCDIRSAVKTRLPHKYVLANATRLLSELVAYYLARGEQIPPVPKLNRMWIYRWKFEHGVSFRKPNKRYKVSLRGLRLRLRIEWLNNIRIRHFARRMLGVDPGEHVDNADEKGWHVNEEGSKNVPTLDYAGAEEVILKENHANTRERLTFMTYTSGNLARIKRGLPTEVCFKLAGPGTRVLPGLTLPRGAYSVRSSSSGSYQEAHVYLFLEFALEPATPERRAAHDWRMFYLDIYSGHLSLRIWEICWSRMYVLQYHGGGTTGLMQTNDLWVHLDLERRLGYLEGLEHTRQALLRKGKIPTMSRQQILNNYFTVWEHDIDHTRSVEWGKRTGLSLALDGSEDVGSAGGRRHWGRGRGAAFGAEPGPGGTGLNGAST